MKSQIQFSQLSKWISNYTDKVEETCHLFEFMWEKFHLFPKQCKAAIDELSHPDLGHSNDEITQKCRYELEKVVQDFGLFSPVYQSLTKMIIDCELSVKDIRRKVREENTLPPAFSDYLVATPSFEMWPVVSFVNNIFDSEYESDPVYRDRYVNVLRLRTYFKRKSKLFFRRLGTKRRLIRLCNGSSTRIEDIVNVQDINGSIYVTQEEYDLIQSMKPLLDWLHIDNFKEEFELIENYEMERTFGSVNYAPDDSAKTRISFTIDSCVQIMAKAFHEYLDFIVKDLSCNGTYRQQAVIRNMIKKGRHYKKGVIISTDMSKYSDTMQRKKMLEVLNWLGVPEPILKCLDILFSLPLWDSVLKRNTGSTNATYQGEYGDFPWITLMNIFNQLATYDYVNFTYYTKYYIDLPLKKVGGILVNRNSMNCAVGDDTIMAFPGWDKAAEDLFEIVKAIFNRVGVNINIAKTHWIKDGQGNCDFVKRFITKDGLIPYLRIQSVVSPSMDERCEELLRFYRDNMIDKEEWDQLVDCFLPEKYAIGLKTLNVLNGGIQETRITASDIKMFYYKNVVYSRLQCLNNKDEMRKWIDIVHENYDIQLKDTHLISFLVQEIDPCLEDTESQIMEEEEEEVLFDSEDAELDFSRESRDLSCLSLDEKLTIKFHSWQEVREAFSEEELITVLLNIMTRGYKYPDFTNINRLIGLTLQEALDRYDDFRYFFIDYQQNEIYRYLYNNRKRKLDVYTRMFTVDLNWLIERNDIYRYPFGRLIRDCGESLNRVLIKQARSLKLVSFMVVHGTRYRYLEWHGMSYRLYFAIKTSYKLMPKDAFQYLLGYKNDLTSDKQQEVDDLYDEYRSHMGRNY